MDRKIREAVELAVSEAEQPSTLSHKIVRWFEAIASGNEEVSDQESADRHLEILFEELKLSPEVGEPEDSSAVDADDE